MVPLAHLSPEPKWHLDWFSHFCAAHGRASLYFAMGRPFPSSKLPIPIDPHTLLLDCGRWHYSKLIDGELWLSEGAVFGV